MDEVHFFPFGGERTGRADGLGPRRGGKKIAEDNEVVSSKKFSTSSPTPNASIHTYLHGRKPTFVTLGQGGHFAHCGHFEHCSECQRGAAP